MPALAHLGTRVMLIKCHWTSCFGAASVWPTGTLRCPTAGRCLVGRALFLLAPLTDGEQLWLFPRCVLMPLPPNLSSEPCPAQPSSSSPPCSLGWHHHGVRDSAPLLWRRILLCIPHFYTRSKPLRKEGGVSECSPSKTKAEEATGPLYH